MELTVDQALQQGVTAHREGKLQDAERLYRAILQAQPQHPDANHNLGVLAVAVGKPLEAIPLFKLALEANPKIEQFWLSYIDVLITLERFDEAQRALVGGKESGVSSDKLDALLQRLQEGVPNDTNKTAKGQTLSEKRKKLAERKKSKKRKAQGDPSSEPSQDQLNHLLGHYQAGKWEEAEALAASLTQQFPKHPFGWKVFGAVLKQTGRLAESLAPMQSAVELSPQDAEAHNNLGNTLKELGSLDEAEASLGQAIALKPDYAEAHSNLGNMLKDLGRLNESESSLRQAIALKPDFAEAHSNLGNTLQELGRLDEAEASIKQAIALKPDFAEAHSNLGNTLQELGRLDEAEASYGQAIALKPDFAEAHSNLGNTLQELGRLDEAEASIKQAIALKPDFAEAHSNLGNTLQELGRLDEAEASYGQAIALKPDFAEAHSNLGNTLQELGRLDEAEASIKQAIALKPDYAEAHYNLGNTLQELGKLDEAEASYGQAIALKPDFAEAHSNLGLLFFESMRYDQAAKHFEQGDTQLSKRYAIQCSYLQDEASIFNGKYDLLVSEGEINAVIGSLGVRSEFEYGTKKANPFCNDPFKYVVRTDLRTQYEFENIFVQTAREVLADSEVSFKVQGHLTNGVQTAGNIFVQGNVPQTEIENIIRTEIEKYRIKFKDSDEGFIKKWPTAYDIKGWLVCMQSGGKLHPHMHDSGWITGSVYINVPPKSKADSGNLVLCLRDGDHPLVSGQQSSIDVVTGSLCLFPSSLHHYTVPFDENEERIVLAFDVVPKAMPSNSTTQILE